MRQRWTGRIDKHLADELFGGGVAQQLGGRNWVDKHQRAIRADRPGPRWRLMCDAIRPAEDLSPPGALHVDEQNRHTCSRSVVLCLMRKASMISSTFMICSTGKSRCRTATLDGWRKPRRPAQLGLFTARSVRRRARSPALPGDTQLSFSLLALGFPDVGAVCPRQLAVQSACAARQPFGTAYGTSLLSGDSWLMLHAINA